MIYTFRDDNGIEYHVDMDDKRFRIKPYQQMLSSCSGALLTSLLSKWLLQFYDLLRSINRSVLYRSITVTPLDVVKTRLQTQQKRMGSHKCFVYCNGLMDHLCPCPNGSLQSLKSQSTHYTGMTVSLSHIFFLLLTDKFDIICDSVNCALCNQLFKCF